MSNGRLPDGVFAYPPGGKRPWHPSHRLSSHAAPACSPPMNSPKKRPVSRGNSPPEKRSRPREPESASASHGPGDRYRLHDRQDLFNQRSSNGRPSSRKGSMDHNVPHQTLSPISMAHGEAATSGSSTPAQIAPTVPTMFPPAVTATASHAKSSPDSNDPIPTTMVSLRAMRARKLQLAQTHGKTYPEARENHSVIDDLRTEVMCLKREMAELKSDPAQASRDEEHSAAIAKLQLDFGALQTLARSLKDAVIGSDHNRLPTKPLRAELVSLQLQVTGLKASRDVLLGHNKQPANALKQDNSSTALLPISSQLKLLEKDVAATKTSLTNDVASLSKGFNLLSKSMNAMEASNVTSRLERLEKSNSPVRLERLEEKLQQVERKLEGDRIDVSREMASLSEQAEQQQSESGIAKTKLLDLDARIDAVEQAASRTAQVIVDVNQLKIKTEADTKDLNSRLLSLKARFLDEDMLAGPVNKVREELRGIVDKLRNDFNDHIATLDKGLLELEHKTHTWKNDITTLRTSIPEFFSSTFTPFKIATQQQLQLIDGRLDLHTNEVQKSLNVEVAGRQSAMQELEQRFASASAELSRANHRIETTIHSFRSLENRYENISTGDLFQNIADYLASHYPNAPVLQQQLHGLRQDMDEVKRTLNNQQIQHLVHIGPQLHALSQNIPEMQKLPQIFRKFDDALAKPQPALSTLEISNEAAGLKQFDTRMNVVAQKTSEELNSAVDGLEHKLGEVQKSLEAKCQKCGDAYASIKAMVDSEQHERIKADEGVRLVAESYATDQQKLDVRVAQAEAEVDKLSRQLDDVSDFIHHLKKIDMEDIKWLCTQPSTLMVAIVQTQCVVDAINNQLPSKVEYRWSALENTRPNSNEGKK